VIILNNQITSIQKEKNYIIKNDSNVHALTNRIEKYILNMESSLMGFIMVHLTVNNQKVHRQMLQIDRLDCHLQEEWS